MWLTSDAKTLISDTRIIPAIQYATQASIYPPENTAAELTTAQTVIISFLYALRQRDVPLIKTLLEVSSSVPQIKSTYLSVWLRDDFCFPRGDVAICLSTLGKLLLDGLQFPWTVAATLASLDVKYCVLECFTEADDTAGQILLSTMNVNVSEGTQVNLAKELMSKESQTTLVKRVSFQLPLETTSTGTQAGLIVHDQGVSVKPEQSTIGVQTTNQNMVTTLNSFTLATHSISPIHKETTSTGTQAGLIVHDRGVSVKPEQSTTGVQATNQSLFATLKPSTLTSDSIHTIQKVTNDPGPGNGQQNLLDNAYGGVQNLAEDRFKSLQTTPDHSYGSLSLPSQNQKKTLSISDHLFMDRKITSKPELTCTTTQIQTPAKLTTDPGTGNGQQILMANAYGGVQNIAEDHFKSLQTTPDHYSMPSQNPKKSPLSINDHLFKGRKVSFKPELTTQIQTTAEDQFRNNLFAFDTSTRNYLSGDHLADKQNVFQKSANDSSLRAETGILAQPTSVNGSRYLPMPQQNRTTASVIIDPKTGVDIFPDVLGEMRKLCKKDMAETSKTVSSKSSVHSSNSSKEVEDGTKHLVYKRVPVSNTNQPTSNTNQPISKGMANELMYSAIQKNDTKSIVVAINAGADVNDEGVMKKRPLHVAASTGRVELAIELIHWGADVNSLDNWEETPLFVASVAGHILLAEVLISAGSNINHMNRERNRPLHVAARAGQLEIVRLLLSSGADVDCRGESFRTPLHCAAYSGHLSVVGLLLEHGADPIAVEVSGHTPLSLAKSNQQNLVVEFLHYRSRF